MRQETLATESNVRAKAKRRGYVVRMSCRFLGTIDNFGHFKLIDAYRNTPVLGYHFDATLDEIDAYLNNIEL
jgi:hypothetical protein